jgi:hypothetical protein
MAQPNYGFLHPVPDSDQELEDAPAAAPARRQPQWWMADDPDDDLTRPTARPTPGGGAAVDPRPVDPRPVDPAPVATAAVAAGPAPGTAVELAPMAPLGRPMNAGELLARSVRHWMGLAAENATRPGGLAHGITAGSPPSAAQHLKYVKSRIWVPEGHPGGFIGPAGALYGRTLGLAGVTIGNGITWVFHKPLRLAALVLLGGIVALFVALFL